MELDEVYENLKLMNEAQQREHDCLVYILGVLSSNRHELGGLEIVELIKKIEGVL